jgi:LytS/YehU family sensor histidine kinase
LNEHLEVQKIHFPQTFSYDATAVKELEIDELQIPAMIIQDFVQNSIEHASPPFFPAGLNLSRSLIHQIPYFQ